MATVYGPCQKFAGGAGHQHEDLVPRMELPKLSGLVVRPLLFVLGSEEVLVDDGANLVDPFLHVLYEFQDRKEGVQLFLTSL